jgi:hypothetical protein
MGYVDRITEYMWKGGRGLYKKLRGRKSKETDMGKIKQR